MKKLVFIPLLISAPALAEWTSVGGTDDFDNYADLATIRKKGDTVKMWVLIDFKTAQRIGRKTRLSSKRQDECDCDGERSRTLYFSWHSGNMGGGNVVHSNASPSEWQPVAPESIDEGLWKIACKP